MKTEPLPLNEPIKVNVDGSASSFPAPLSLLPPPAGIGLHIGNIEEVKGNALFCQRRSLTSPVPEEIASWPSVRKQRATIGVRCGHLREYRYH